jgi:hypothetical protein
MSPLSIGGNITASSVAVSKIEIPYGPPLFYAVK